MKLSEITKKDFLNTLMDPEIAGLRTAIKEFRQHLNQWGWKTTSRYDKHQRTFAVNTRIVKPSFADLITGSRVVDRVQVYTAISEFFPPSKYRIDINQKNPENITFWVTTEPQA